MDVAAFVLGLIVGAVLGALAWALLGHRRYGRQAAQLQAQRDLAAQQVASLEQQLQQAQRQGEQLNEKLRTETAAHAATRTKLDQTEATIQQARQNLTDAFKALADEALKSNNKAFVQLAQQTLQALINQAKGDIGKQQEQIDALVKPLKDALQRYQDQIQKMEKDRAGAFGTLREYLDRLSQQTQGLETALRQPHVRGRWGELTLKRVLEFAGLTENVHYSLQVSVEADGQQQRPDAVVYLPGNLQIVIDAKVPLSAYEDAAGSDSEQRRAEAMQRHARLVRDHIARLGSKSYFEQFPTSPQFVVMFLPGESFLIGALQADPTLIEFASQRRVTLAAPSTLVPLLWTVAFAWRQEQLTRSAEQISQLGRELYERMSVFVRHLEAVGKSLNKTVENYNRVVGSLERRVLPSARRFKELGAGTAEEIATLDQVHAAAGTPPQLEAGQANNAEAEQ